MWKELQKKGGKSWVPETDTHRRRYSLYLGGTIPHLLGRNKEHKEKEEQPRKLERE